MSLILDAIKKSERERQQQAIPDLASNHRDYLQKPTSNKKRWIFSVMGFSLVLLLGWMAFSFYFKQIAVEAGVRSINQPVTKNLKTKNSTEPASKENTIQTMTVISRRSLKLEQPPKNNASPKKKQPVSEISSKVSIKPSVVKGSDTESPVVHQVVEQQLKNEPTDAPMIPQNAKYPSLFSMDKKFQSQIPAIQFTSHVFTGDESTSFVSLNQRMLGAGEWLTDELKITHITADGVMLEYRGQSFFLEALQSWTP